MHIPIERLKAFLLLEVPLLAQDHEHLVRCAECMKAMVKAALDELLREDKAS